MGEVFLLANFDPPNRQTFSATFLSLRQSFLKNIKL